MIYAESLLLLIASTLFLSYLSGIIYYNTKIPDLVWVLAFGILLGPVLGVFNVDIFLNVFDLMILVTVALFAFNTGISFNIQNILDGTSRALAMAFMSFMAITLAVGGAVHLLVPGTFSLFSGLLLGAMVSGIDSVLISSLLSGMEDSKRLAESGTFLQLEATLADPIKVVGVSTLIQMASIADIGARTAIRDVLFTLVFSTIIGIGAGLIWGQVITRLRDRPLNYMMTIASLFPVYVFSDAFSGNGGGPISVFLFGAVLMNYGYVTKSFNLKRRSRIDRRKIREYHDEITFLIKSMFFVYLGLMMKIEVSYIVVSMIIAIIIILVRNIVVSLVGLAYDISGTHMVFYRFFFIQGPSSLVLTQYLTEYDPFGIHFPSAQVYTSLVVPIVLLSILFSSIISPIIAGKQISFDPETAEKKEKKEEPKKG